MPLDLELELLRAVHAIVVRTHVKAVTVDELLDSLRARAGPSRLASPLLAHLVSALAETLVAAGFLERVSGGGYALTPHAISELGREPAMLAKETWPEGTSASELCLRGDDA